VSTIPAATDPVIAKSTVSLFAWFAFLVSAVLFLLTQPSNPVLFTIRCVGWGLFLWVPAAIFIMKKKRNGVTIFATLFLLAAAFDAYVEFEKTRILGTDRYPTLQLEAKKKPDALDGWINTTSAEASVQSPAPSGSNPLKSVAAIDKAKRHVESGESYYKKNEYDNALKEYDAAISIDSNCYDAYCSRGAMWLYGKNHPENAIRDFTKAIAINPQGAFTYVLRGQAWYEIMEYDKAIEDNNTAIRIDSDNRVKAVAYASRSAVWRKKGDMDKARIDRDTAARLDPMAFGKK
jgi:tetratricopeptide (TPR) repeat protein